MHLTLRGSCSDGTPTDEIGIVLRGDGVEELVACRHAHRGQIYQEFSRHMQSLVDVVGAVETGIVDQSLPSDSRSGLFEVHSHHHQNAVPDFIRQGFQPLGIGNSNGWVMDGTAPGVAPDTKPTCARSPRARTRNRIEENRT